MATAALTALRNAYPDAHITWAVGGWSRQAVENHPHLDAILDTGSSANPAGTILGLPKFIGQLRNGNFDMAVSLSRSPLMSAAVWLSGIPRRAGIDSAGRGFGYNVRSPLNPLAQRHEVDIYLDVIKRLGWDTKDILPNVPVDMSSVDAPIQTYIIVNPSGGRNPGAQMDAKRYPPKKLAYIVNTLAKAWQFEHVVIVAGPDDDLLVQQLQENISKPYTSHIGALSFTQIGALAANALLYIGNDTGLTHYAAAAGAKTAMILGPTNPKRYAAYSPNAIALWKAYSLPESGFAGGAPPAWNWDVDGISPEDAAEKIIQTFV
jgi:ADP-heptose:LPS heptosyltransferase